MSTPSFDPVQYKAAQRQQWDTVAAGWRRWWETIERGAQHVSDRLVELAAIQPGHRVLDVATGIGEPAITAARRVGPAGRVVATDQSPKMLAIARERAAALELHNLDFREMDAEALDFPERSFNAILCRWGLMFLPHPAAALDHVRRLLVPRGRFAATVWDVPPKVPMLSVAMGVVQRILQPPPRTPSLFSLADPGVLEHALLGAGFADVQSERVMSIAEFPSVEAYTTMLKDVAAPVMALLADQPAERRAEVFRAIAEAARAYTAADGRVRMSNQAICAVGRRA
ncbi:MAG: class I SAM-dependent methyltransferase [Candidatus Methylomirabilales bacterium]